MPLGPALVGVGVCVFGWVCLGGAWWGGWGSVLFLLASVLLCLGGVWFGWARVGLAGLGSVLGAVAVVGGFCGSGWVGFGLVWGWVGCRFVVGLWVAWVGVGVGLLGSFWRSVGGGLGVVGFGLWPGAGLVFRGLFGFVGAGVWRCAGVGSLGGVLCLGWWSGRWGSVVWFGWRVGAFCGFWLCCLFGRFVGVGFRVGFVCWVGLVWVCSVCRSGWWVCFGLGGVGSVWWVGLVWLGRWGAGWGRARGK